MLLQVRLMLVLAPAACCLAGVAVHEVLRVLMQAVRQPSEPEDAPAPVAEPKKATPQPKKGKAAVKVTSTFLFRSKPTTFSSFPHANLCSSLQGLKVREEAAHASLIWPFLATAMTARLASPILGFLQRIIAEVKGCLAPLHLILAEAKPSR